MPTIELTWQIIIILGIIIMSSAFILATGNTIYCLLSLISLVLALSWFLIYAGLEYLGFMLSIIYLGAILIFFVFVIMLVDLRFEDLQEIYEEAKTYEPQGIAILYPLTVFISMIFLDLIVERVLYEDYSHLEYFLQPTDLRDLNEMSVSLISEHAIACSHSPAAVGFFLFSLTGTAVGLLSLLILFSLYISLYTVESANEDVMARLGESADRKLFRNAIKRLK